MVRQQRISTGAFLRVIIHLGIILAVLSGCGKEGGGGNGSSLSGTPGMDSNYSYDEGGGNGLSGFDGSAGPLNNSYASVPNLTGSELAVLRDVLGNPQTNTITQLLDKLATGTDSMSQFGGWAGELAKALGKGDDPAVYQELAQLAKDLQSELQAAGKTTDKAKRRGCQKKMAGRCRSAAKKISGILSKGKGGAGGGSR